MKDRYTKAISAANQAHEFLTAREIRDEAATALQAAVAAGEYGAAAEILDDLGQKICLICMSEPSSTQFRIAVLENGDHNAPARAYVYTCDKCWNRIWQDADLMAKVQGFRRTR